MYTDNIFLDQEVEKSNICFIIIFLDQEMENFLINKNLKIYIKIT